MRRWRLKRARSDLKDLLQKELRVSSILATLLVNRGIDSVEGASRFLSPRLSNLHNPFLLKGMREGVDRIVRAIVNGETIGIYGDYDVDGISGTALLYLFLKEVGARPVVYIPDRLREGYGLKREGILALKEKGAGLIITVDCGITNAKEVAFAREKGMDVVVTDHHEVPEDLPPALGVINPKQPGCPFPFKGLSGVGVAFNLVIALRTVLRDSGLLSSIPNLREYLDLVALGTLGDVVPLVDENRIFLKYGLKEIEEGRRPGIKALKEVSGASKGVDVWNLLYQLIPRINAGGRMGESYLPFRLLTACHGEEARDLARRLDELNSLRQRTEEKVLMEAQKMVEEKGVDGLKGLFLHSRQWHPGVIGIVASRLVERYGLPVFMIALDGGKGRGSVRGVEGCDVVECLRRCSHLLEGFGGHELAAGFTVREEMVGSLEEGLMDALETHLPHIPAREIWIDAMVEPGDLSERTVEEMELLTPHGVGNPEPVLAFEGIRIMRSRIVGDDHLNIYLEKGGRFFDAIGFRMGNGASLPRASQHLNLAFTPFVDEWDGMRRLRLMIRDIRPHEP